MDLKNCSNFWFLFNNVKILMNSFFQDDSMTQEAILKAEEELKVTKETEPAAAPPKINRTAVTAAVESESVAGEAASDGKENAGTVMGTRFSG